MTSKSGLNMARNILLHPMAMPKGTPTTTENSSAVSTRRMEIHPGYIIGRLATSPDQIVISLLSEA